MNTIPRMEPVKCIRVLSFDLLSILFSFSFYIKKVKTLKVTENTFGLGRRTEQYTVHSNFLAAIKAVVVFTDMI